MQSTRLVLYHKQSTSARILFFCLDGTVCQPSGLPPRSQIVSSTLEEEEATVTPPPPAFVAEVAKKLGISEEMLEVEAEFQAIADSAGDAIAVYLTRFTTIDPPYEQIESGDGRLIAITEARRLPPVELELLRLIYSFLMDG
ncbi:MAG: hypothetical protein SVX43_16900 [Cyanobacteriota bacterium]|nr:hypothetical protein [Cyanobacteriota bacterium]